MKGYGLIHLKTCFELLRSSKINELARQTGFIQQDRQLKVTNFLPFLFRNHTKLVSDTLNELCLDLRLHQVPMTRAGLNKRFDGQCVDFLSRIFEELFSFNLRKCSLPCPLIKNSLSNVYGF